jgi:predicted nucleic acid-binding protein
VIVDTSVWIDWLLGIVTPEVLHLVEEQRAGHRLSLLPTIYREILQGARSMEDFRRLDSVFAAFPMESLPNQAETARTAAELYARCRWSAVTIRNVNDCVIAASCVLLDLPLLHNDRDFLRLGKLEPRLKLIPDSIA